MSDIREIHDGETAVAGSALLALRPRWETTAALVDLIDSRLRPAGYRLLGAFEEEHTDALAVAGFRVLDTLAWGRVLYVDDLSTHPAHRGAGHAQKLLDWVTAEGTRLACESLQLDSGVGPDRAAAHRLYMRHHMRISAHHFHRDL